MICICGHYRDDHRLGRGRYALLETCDHPRCLCLCFTEAD